MKIIHKHMERTLIETECGQFFQVYHSDARYKALRIHSIKRAEHHDHGCYSNTDINPFDCKKSLPTALKKAIRDLILRACVTTERAA